MRQRIDSVPRERAVRLESGMFLVGNGSRCRDALPLPFPIKDQLSLLPRSDAGTESRSLRSIRSHPFDPYLRDVRASPSGCCRFGQARMTQASTMLEIRIERIERIASVLGDGAVRMGSDAFFVGK